MGYSCTQAADNMLGLIRKSFGSPDKGSNTLIIGGKEYFYEVGREQADGAITGSLYLMVSPDSAQKAGTFRIDADGTINRFPGLSAKAKNALTVELNTTPGELLRRYSMGVI